MTPTPHTRARGVFPLKFLNSRARELRAGGKEGPDELVWRALLAYQRVVGVVGIRKCRPPPLAAAARARSERDASGPRYTGLLLRPCPRLGGGREETAATWIG